MFANPLTEKLAAFVRGIGIEVRAATLDEPTFFPGVDIQYGAVLIDEARLKHPADILHEAGHIAVTDPARAPRVPPRAERRRGDGDARVVLCGRACTSAFRSDVAVPPRAAQRQFADAHR